MSEDPLNSAFRNEVHHGTPACSRAPPTRIPSRMTRIHRISSRINKLARYTPGGILTVSGGDGGGTQQRICGRHAVREQARVQLLQVLLQRAHARACFQLGRQRRHPALAGVQRRCVLRGAPTLHGRVSAAAREAAR
jgi:hypothetical protein